MISDRLKSTTTDWLSQHSEIFRASFELLKGLPADAPDGITELDGTKHYIHVQGYDTLPSSECRWESHRHTIDIQYIFAGGEAIDYQRPGVLAPKNDYNPEKEVEFWHAGATPAATLLMTPGTWVIFLANEPHRPKGADGVNPSVRKAVVKIDASLTMTA